MNSNLKLFITGGTGYIGGAIIREYLSKSFLVTALVRDLQRSSYLEKLGVKLVKGDLTDSSLLINESADHDVIIHAARDHGNQANELELQAVKALLSSANATAEKKKCLFIYTTGTFVLGEGEEVKDEYSSTENPFSYAVFRTEIEKMVLNYNNQKNLFTSVVRPTWVYGCNSGHVTDYLKFVIKEKFVTLLDKGTVNVNFIQVEDLARLFYLIYEKNGSGVYHGTDNVYIKANELNDLIAKILNVEKKEYDTNEAYKQYGFFTYALTINQKIVTKRANELGWILNHKSIIESLENICNEAKN